MVLPDDPVRDLVDELWRSESKLIRARVASTVRGDSHLVDDIVHEAYVRLLRHLRTGGDVPPNPRAWLTLTAKRIVIDHSRLASTRREDLRGLVADTTEEVDFDAVEDREEAQGILAGLTPLQRTVMQMRDFEDLSTKTVAERLGLTGQAVRSIRHKAVRKIRKGPDQ